MKKWQLGILAFVWVSMGTLLGLFLQAGGGSWDAPNQALAVAPGDAPVVTDVRPDAAPNDLDTPVVITGTGFAAVPSGTLAYLGDTALEEVMWVNATTLSATIPWGLEPGVYTLTVVNPDGGTGSLPNAFTVTQGIDVWNTGEFYGGRVEQLVINPLTPTTVYAVSAHAGIFRSRDDGSSWSLKIAGPGYIMRRLALDPLSPNRLYLFDTFGFGRSDDEGDTWTAVDLPGEVPALQAFPHPLISGTLFAANHFLGGCGLWKSTDSAQTWITITESSGLIDTCVTDMAFHPTDPQMMVAGSGELFRSTDGGETWSYAADYRPSAMAFNPFGAHELWLSDNGTYKSTNAGYSEWAPVGDPVGSRQLASIAFAPVTWGGAYSGTVFVADSDGNAFKTTDGGDTWEPFGPQAQVLAIALHPTDPNVIYASSSCGGVYKTLDGGATWQQVNQGLTAMVPYELATVPGQPDLAYALIEGCAGVFEGTQGGDTWQFLEVEGASIEMESSLLADPHTPARLYRSGYGTIYRSDDGGQTWPTSGTLPPPAVCSGETRIAATELQADASQPNTLLAGAHASCNTPADWIEIGDIYRSTDGGLTWATTLASGQIISAVTALAYDYQVPAIVYAGTCWNGEYGSGLWKSTDGGQSWQPAGTGVPQLRDCIRSIATEPAPPYRLLVGISSGSTDEHTLYVSTDHGETWQRAGLPINWGVSTLLFTPGTAPVLYAATNSLLRSTDGGQSWTQAAGVLGQVPVYSLAAAAATDRVVLYAGTTGGYVESGGAQALNVADGDGTLVNAGVYRYTTLQSWNLYLPLVLRTYTP